MFCQNCGTQITQNAAFCPICGQPMTASQPQSVSSASLRMQNREDELHEINRMIAYFSVKQSQFDELDAVRERLQPKYLRKRPSLLVWGIISAFWGFMFLFNGGIPIGVALLLGAGAMVFAFVRSTQIRKENYAAARQRFYELSEELERYHAGYGPCIVSVAYANPYTLAAIRDIIQSGRANTITDALNMLLQR